MVETEGTWEVDQAKGTNTFTPQSGFTESPAFLQYTVADKNGLRSNPGKVIVNGQITEFIEAFGKLAALSDDDFWKDFQANVIDIDYDISVIYAAADGLLTATRTQLADAEEKEIFDGARLTDIGLRVGAVKLGKEFVFYNPEIGAIEKHKTRIQVENARDICLGGIKAALFEKYATAHGADIYDPATLAKIDTNCAKWSEAKSDTAAFLKNFDGKSSTIEV